MSTANGIALIVLILALIYIRQLRELFERIKIIFIMLDTMVEDFKYIHPEETPAEYAHRLMNRIELMSKMAKNRTVEMDSFTLGKSIRIVKATQEEE